MNSVVLFMIVFSFSLAVLSFHYHNVVKPTFQDMVRFKLFAKRDELRKLAITGTVDPASFSFRHLEDMINGMANSTKWYSVSIWIESMVWKASHPESQAEIKELMSRFEEQASEEEKKIERSILSLIFCAMAANSPGWMIFGGVLCAIKSMNKRFVGWNRALWYRIGSGYQPLHA